MGTGDPGMMYFALYSLNDVFAYSVTLRTVTVFCRNSGTSLTLSWESARMNELIACVVRPTDALDRVTARKAAVVLSSVSECLLVTVSQKGQNTEERSGMWYV